MEEEIIRKFEELNSNISNEIEKFEKISEILQTVNGLLIEEKIDCSTAAMFVIAALEELPQIFKSEATFYIESYLRKTIGLPETREQEKLYRFGMN